MLHYENKEIDFNLNGITRTFKAKNIQLAIDEINLFKKENNLDYYDLMKLDNFIECANSLKIKLSEIRSAAAKYNDLHPDKFIDFISNIPESDCAKKDWSTYILVDVDSEFVKIGKTGDIKRRSAELKNNSGRELILLYLFDFDIESRLHLVFGEFRKTGEWFSIPRSILIEKVESLKSQIQPDIFIN